MAWAWFLDAQTYPWTQGLYMSRLSSTPGTREFRIRVVLLLAWLPTKAAEPSLPTDVWLFARSCFSFNILVGVGLKPMSSMWWQFGEVPNFEASLHHLNPSAAGPHDNL